MEQVAEELMVGERILSRRRILSRFDLCFVSIVTVLLVGVIHFTRVPPGCRGDGDPSGEKTGGFFPRRIFGIFRSVEDPSGEKTPAGSYKRAPDRSGEREQEHPAAEQRPTTTAGAPVPPSPAPARTQRAGTSSGTPTPTSGPDETRVDVVVVTATWGCVVELVVDSLRRYLRNIGRIHALVGSAEALKKCEERLTSPDDDVPVRCVSESSMIDTDALLATLSRKNSHGWQAALTRKKWYLQQLLKLTYPMWEKDNLSEDFLLWDADNVLVKEYSPWYDVVSSSSNEKHTRKNSSPNSAPPERIPKFLTGGVELFGKAYDVPTKALIGAVPTRWDMVTHQMLVRKAWLFQLLERIGCSTEAATVPSRDENDPSREDDSSRESSSNQGPQLLARRLASTACAELILSKIPARANREYGLSEYHLYFTFVSQILILPPRRTISPGEVPEAAGATVAEDQPSSSRSASLSRSQSLPPLFHMAERDEYRYYRTPKGAAPGSAIGKRTVGAIGNCTRLLEVARDRGRAEIGEDLNAVVLESADFG